MLFVFFCKLLLHTNVLHIDSLIILRGTHLAWKIDSQKIDKIDSQKIDSQKTLQETSSN